MAKVQLFFNTSMLKIKYLCPVEFIDTHTHIYLPEFAQDRTDMMQRSADANVGKMILPNIDLDSIPQIQNMQASYPKKIAAAMGLHPTSVSSDFEQVLQTIYQTLTSGNYIAIGEIGIDLYWDKSKQVEQIEAFKQQINWAKQLKLPIIIHARDSFKEIFKVMDEQWSPELNGVFHCFSGTKAEALKIITDYKFKLGIGGVLTFKNSNLKTEIQDIDLKHIVLETDAPYLTPVPYRGQRNESAYIPIIAKHLATLKNCSIQNIADITTANAKSLFNI